MGRSQFKITVGWSYLRSSVWVSEQLRSNTLVLLSPHPLSNGSVERVSSRSPHIPEKGTVYRVITHYNGSNSKRDPVLLKPQRLDRAPVGSVVLVELPVNRMALCFKWDETTHGIQESDDNGHVRTYCGFTPDIWRGEPRVQEGFIPDSHPDCPTCLEVGTAWHSLYVYPYEHKRDLVRQTSKMKRKEKAKARIRAASLTFFERLLLEDALSPPPKPLPARTEPPEPDIEDVLTVITREDKLRSRRESGKAFKSALREAKRR